MDRESNQDTDSQHIYYQDHLDQEGVLDPQLPWTYRKLISVLSSKVQIDYQAVDGIREQAAKGPVVYAMKYRSEYDLHFVRSRFDILGLPVPSFVFGMSCLTSCSLSRAYRICKSKLTRHKQIISRHMASSLLTRTYTIAVKGLMTKAGAQICRTEKILYFFLYIKKYVSSITSAFK